MKREQLIDEIKNYKNREVIFNFYQNEELEKREYVKFETIKIENEKLICIKNNQTVFELFVPNYACFQNEATFSRFYSISYEEYLIEIFFM